MFGGDGSLSFLLYRGRRPLICVLLGFGYGFLTPQVCSWFSPPLSPAPSSFCSQSIESGAVFLGVEASSKSSARGNCFGGASGFGFKLGFSPSQSLKPAKRNKPSAYEHPSVIDEYLATEVSSGRVAGPFASPPVPLLHVSRKGSTGKRGVSLWISPPPEGLA